MNGDETPCGEAGASEHYDYEYSAYAGSLQHQRGGYGLRGDIGTLRSIAPLVPARRKAFLPDSNE
jgi:hypothetical protein